MYVFIATIFIAELIIVGTLILFTVKIDKKVIDAKTSVEKSSVSVVSVIKEIHDILISAQSIMNNAVTYINKKKHEFRQKLINLAIIYAILVVFKLKFKRAAVILQYALLAKDLWNRIPV